MKTRALCHGKLGMGTRFRNIWNRRWWAHVRLFSVRCESIYGAAWKLWNHSRKGRIAPGATAQRPAADRTADFDSEAADSPPPA